MVSNSTIHIDHHCPFHLPYNWSRKDSTEREFVRTTNQRILQQLSDAIWKKRRAGWHPGWFPVQDKKPHCIVKFNRDAADHEAAAADKDVQLRKYIGRLFCIKEMKRKPSFADVHDVA